MGNKIPFDIAERVGGMNRNDSIYNTDKNVFPSPNKWGYRYNVNHPSILPLFKAYHKKIGVPDHIHMTSAQRMHFEMCLDRMIEKKRGGNHE